MSSEQIRDADRRGLDIQLHTHRHRSSHTDSDDLEQEIWLTTMRRPPRNEVGLRGWFRSVARSRAIDGTRGNARRAALLESAEEATAPSTES